MKKYYIFLFALCITLQIVAKNQIAIYVIGDASDSYKKVVASSLTQAINNDGHFQAVERTSDFLGAIGSEISYQNSGAVSQARISELGRQFGAQYVFVVDLNYVLGELYASSRIINVESNIVEAASDKNSKVSDLDQLRNLANQISAATLAKLPYNIEKERQKKYDKAQRDIIQKTHALPLTNAGDIWLCYESSNFRYVSEYDALNYINACKKLGVKVDYPVYYRYPEVDTDRMIFDKKANEAKVSFKIYYIKESGEKGSCTFTLITDFRMKYLKNKGARLGGSFLYYTK